LVLARKEGRAKALAKDQVPFSNGKKIEEKKELFYT